MQCVVLQEGSHKWLSSALQMKLKTSTNPTEFPKQMSASYQPDLQGKAMRAEPQHTAALPAYAELPTAVMAEQGSNTCRFTKIIWLVGWGAEPVVLAAWLGIKQNKVSSWEAAVPASVNKLPLQSLENKTAAGEEETRSCAMWDTDIGPEAALCWAEESRGEFWHQLEDTPTHNGVKHVQTHTPEWRWLRTGVCSRKGYRGTITTSEEEKLEPWDCWMSTWRRGGDNATG